MMNPKHPQKQSVLRHSEMLSTAFGPEISELMVDPDVIEIMLNADGKLWAESLSQGKYFTNINLDNKRAANVIKLVAASRQAIANEVYPEVAYELPESYARFEGWLPPVVSSPVFVIRKRAAQVFSLDDYVKSGALSESHALLLRKAIQNKKNILIAGGTASGKTTFANALLHELASTQDRVIVLEDLPELQIYAADYVALRTTKTISMRDLVKGILRMRPDRIIIGEVRDGAALDLLKAWNTGHPGGICTIHANSPKATLSRLEDLIQETVSIVPKRLIAEAIDFIVFMQRQNSEYSIRHIHEYTNGELIEK